MNEAAFTRCSNATGALALFLSLQNAGEAAALFSQNASFELPLNNISLMGHAQIQDYLEARFLSEGRDLYFLTNPYFFEQEDTARGSCFVIGYHISDVSSNLFGTRFDIIFDANFLIQKMSWYDMLSLGKEQGAVLCQDKMGFVFSTLLSEDTLGTDEYFQIRHCFHRRIQEDVIQTQESLQFPYNEVITGTDQEAQIIRMLLTFNYHPEQDAFLMKAELQKIYIRKGEHWEIVDQKRQTIAELPALGQVPTPPQAAEMIHRKISVPLPAGSHTLSAIDEVFIEQQAAKWTGAIRSCNPSAFCEEALAQDAPDLQADVIAPVQGIEGFQREFITMETMWKLQPGYQGVHTMTCGCLEEISDTEAEGIWLDLGWTILGPMFGNGGPTVPVLPNVGRYRMKFRKYEDGWKVYDFNWGPLIQYGHWTFDATNTDGWFKRMPRKQWPALHFS